MRTFQQWKGLIGLLFLSAFLLLPLQKSFSQQITTPSTFFGFEPGDDYKLFGYAQLIEYLKLLEQQSDRIMLEEIGQSWMQKPLYVLAISSADNIRGMDKLKEINQKLALSNDLDETEKPELFQKGKVFVAATMSMHSNEVGPTQSVPLIAYDLATTDDPVKLRWLDETVLVIVPSHNPDGHDMVVDHYKKYLGTPYEKSAMPGVYHKYVGHNINRDFIMLTQPENVAVSKLFSHHWFPQVAVERHQMGAAGVRYFVPPPTDPIAENIDAGLWNWIGIFGARMMQRMTADSLKGVTQNYLFDMYWPGPTETSLWKNVISMLTEAASAHLATPVYVEPQELQVYGKGLSEYKKSINMPYPWPGGWWRLRDIIDYEISALWGMMEAAATHREEILRFRLGLTEGMVKLGHSSAPYYYILPAEQHDKGSLNNLISLLHQHGVKTYRLTDQIESGHKVYRKGDVVVPLAQPFRAFIKEVMEVQQFPVRHYSPGGEMMRPYDITSWSLPLHMGVQAFEINQAIPSLESNLEPLTAINHVDTDAFKDTWGLVFPAASNESYAIAFKALAKGLEVNRVTQSVQSIELELKEGDFLIVANNKMQDLWQDVTVPPISLHTKPNIEYKPVKMPRIGLVETFYHDMDAGWTRYIFDQHQIPYQLLRPADLKDGVPQGLQLLVFPSNSKSVLIEGAYGREGETFLPNYPPEYTKGMGREGLEKLMAWVNNGGKVVSWEQSTKLFEGALQFDKGKGEKESFRLPFRDISADLVKSGLDVPGALLNIELLKGHPLTYGMQKNARVFARSAPVFATSIPVLDMDRRIIAAYSEKDILASGYTMNEKLLSQKASMIWLKKGKGQLVLFAFNPQFRSNTHGTYKLFFNALLLE